MDWMIIIWIAYLIPLCICVCMILQCLWKHVCKNSTVYRAYFGKLQFVYRCRSEKTPVQEWLAGAEERTRKAAMQHMLWQHRHLD